MDIFDKCVIHDDMTIDCLASVYLNRKNLKKLPEFIQFNVAKNHFSISENRLLDSLRGCPYIVDGYFSCSDNALTSLKDCPKIVKQSFFCGNNKKKFTNEDVKKYCKITDNRWIELGN